MLALIADWLQGALSEQIGSNPWLLRAGDLERALAKLSDERRSVLLLVGMEGMSYGVADDGHTESPL